MTRWLPALILLAGCTPKVETVIRTVEVMVPVHVKAEAPPELMAPYKPTVVPVFVAPADPTASSALTPAGEKALRDILEDLTARDQAWRVWAAP